MPERSCGRLGHHPSRYRAVSSHLSRAAVSGFSLRKCYRFRDVQSFMGLLFVRKESFFQMNSGVAANLETPTMENVTGPANGLMNRLLADWRVPLLVLIGLWAAIYMSDLSRPALLDDADTVHAEAAREMLQRHDWVTLYTNGFRYLEKAPLMYWSLAASYRIFGVGTWSTRLPLMLVVLALVLVTYWLGRHVYGAAGGLYAGVALLTSLGLYIYTRFLIPEVLVALWLTLGFYFFLRALEEERPSRFTCWGFAAACAFNILTKGLVGL